MASLKRNLFSTPTSGNNKRQNILQLPTQNDDYDKVITINVRGKKFQVLESTILKVDTKISRQYLGREQNVVDEEGNLFYDRNPKVFNYIIDYLNIGEFFGAVNIDPSLLEKELEYFGILF